MMSIDDRAMIDDRSSARRGPERVIPSDQLGIRAMGKNEARNVRFFESAARFRAWLEKHHDSVAELNVGFYRKDSGKGGITYAEALDEALCYGWIDGVKRTRDEAS